MREVTADALLTLARVEIAELKRLGYGPAGPQRRKSSTLPYTTCSIRTATCSQTEEGFCNAITQGHPAHRFEAFELRQP